MTHKEEKESKYKNPQGLKQQNRVASLFWRPDVWSKSVGGLGRFSEGSRGGSCLVSAWHLVVAGGPGCSRACAGIALISASILTCSPSPSLSLLFNEDTSHRSKCISEESMQLTVIEELMQNYRIKLNTISTLFCYIYLKKKKQFRCKTLAFIT